MLRIGQRLQNERLAQGFSLDEVAKATKIRSQFLSALEKGDYKTLPSSAYIQGFIRNYAEFLGLPIRETMALFKREFDEREFLGVLPESFTRKQTRPLQGFRIGPLTMLFSIIILFALGFIFFAYRAAFFSPNITIIAPKEGAIITSQVVSVNGRTDPGTTITVNDQTAYIQKDGSFSKDISVFSGQTTIVIKAVNAFGKRSEVDRHVTVK